MALKIKEGSQLQRELHRNRRQLDNEIDPELVQTYEEYQTQYSSKLGKCSNSISLSINNSNSCLITGLCV